MKDIEEKIKEFFSSEENIKKLMSNEEFMNKISDGVVDAKTYQSEFKKLGLDLTDEEAAQTAEITNKLVTTPPEKLEEISLENVVGGHSSLAEGAYLGLIIGGVTGLLGLATAAGAIACYVKSEKYEKNGNIAKASRYTSLCGVLGGISASALMISVPLTIIPGASLINYSIERNKELKKTPPK